ncbi:MAG: helix-turn-helix domain-containing protein [Planctomycetaceae bacterium]
MRQLAGYDWPGNVRQLRNVIRRGCILASGPVISQIDLPDAEPSSAPTLPFPRLPEELPLREVEKQVILQRLKLFDGNRTRTAEALGVTTRTLRNKLAEYRADRDAA